MSSTTPHGFRRWRRTRPFWGGLFAVLGGLEIISIPLAPMPIVIHQGMAGIASWLFGALLVVAGLLLWFQPAQRSFFGVLAVLLSLGSFLTSNFGGFLLGMLLGLLGGALGFAWTPGAKKRRGRNVPPAPPAPPVPSADVLVAGEALATDTLVEVSPLPGQESRRGAHAAPRGGRILGLALPIAAAPALLGGHLLSPSPSPTPSTAVSPSTSASPSTSPSASPSASPTPSASPSATPSAKPKAKSAGSVAGAYSDLSTLRASSLAMSGLSYDGVADLQTRQGTVKALKFSMDKAVLKNVDQTVRHGAASSAMRTPRLTLTGGVIMYTTKMSSKLLGIPLTFTPEHPPPLVLPIMTMTDVVSEQPSVSARVASAVALSIGA
ncbi:DUF6114 domain-containing protein [Spirillospora sp. NPDC052269]